MPNIIEVKDLYKKYGDFTAVDHISFSVKEGEIFGILGPNGAGKTTTLEILEGLKLPTSGSIVVDGIDVQKHPTKVKARIGVQLQASNFFEALTLVELIETFGAMYGREVDAMKLLEQVQLTDKAKNQAKELSGGQRQRLSIAIGLVNDPRILFLDEPTTGLDPQARRNLWDLIGGIKKDGTTVVITTHYMDEAEVLCDRVAIMDGGTIVSMDTPRKLIDQLLATGFSKPVVQQQANLEDVFLNFTGHALRE
ncbi:MAG: ABC transporter ATP-binding protein [Patescibacteria group bacterium]